VAVLLTLVQTKQIRINIHKRNNTTTQYKRYKTQYIQIHILPKHTLITKLTHTHTHPHITKPKHTHTHPHITKHSHLHTLTYYTTSSNNHSTRYTPNEIVTIQSNTLSIR